MKGRSIRSVPVLRCYLYSRYRACSARCKLECLKTLAHVIAVWGIG